MQCSIHGDKRPAFICKHLLVGKGLDFIKSEEPLDPEWPFKNSWCAECNEVL